MALLTKFGRARNPDGCFARRPAAWKEFEPLDIACAAAVGVESGLGSVVASSSPCPLAVIETFRGVAVRVFEPLRPVIENLVREGMAEGSALSVANRVRIIEAAGARLPIVEVWHDLLYYTDREHFIPWTDHRVRRLKPEERQPGKGKAGAQVLPFHLAYGVFAKRHLAAYADIAVRGDYACSLGVFTESEYRGQGMAKSAVSSATRAILRAGRIPLYSTDEENKASLAVCRSLGYLRFGRDLYCFMASEEERARREHMVQEEERRAADFALHRWIID
jgi:RimJ/RimL family protein N-acetyltransferase